MEPVRMVKKDLLTVTAIVIIWIAALIATANVALVIAEGQWIVMDTAGRMI